MHCPQAAQADAPACASSARVARLPWHNHRQRHQSLAARQRERKERQCFSPGFGSCMRGFSGSSRSFHAEPAGWGCLQEMASFVDHFTDMPSLVAPKVEILLATLKCARDEIMWHLWHTPETLPPHKDWPPKGTTKEQRVEWEREQITDLVHQHDCVSQVLGHHQSISLSSVTLFYFADFNPPFCRFSETTSRPSPSTTPPISGRSTTLRSRLRWGWPTRRSSGTTRGCRRSVTPTCSTWSAPVSDDTISPNTPPTHNAQHMLHTAFHLFLPLAAHVADRCPRRSLH